MSRLKEFALSYFRCVIDSFTVCIQLFGKHSSAKYFLAIICLYIHAYIDMVCSMHLVNPSSVYFFIDRIFVTVILFKYGVSPHLILVMCICSSIHTYIYMYCIYVSKYKMPLIKLFLRRPYYRMNNPKCRRRARRLPPAQMLIP